MKKYYHRTIVVKDVFSDFSVYIVTLILVIAVMLSIMIKFNIKPDDRYVLKSFKEIMAIENTGIFRKKSIYDIFSEIVPLSKSSEEMMKKYSAYYNGVKKESSLKEQKGFLHNKQFAETDMSKEGIVFNNATTYSVNAEELLDTELVFCDPSVLIVHTHTSESYAEYENARSTDEEQNVVKIGRIIKERLERQGIAVIHDTTRNDYPAYNGSYNKALGVIEKNLAAYPDIQVVLDIHRDYTSRTENGQEIQLRPVGSINGKKLSQVMFVVGTDFSGLNHPDWRHNLAFAVRINAELDKISENIARPINIRKERFNQHMSPGSLIIEVGSASNYLYESENAAQYIGDAVAEVLKKYQYKK